MVWGEGGGGKFFTVEVRVREHSCLPAQVSIPATRRSTIGDRAFVVVFLQRTTAFRWPAILLTVPWTHCIAYSDYN